MRIIVIGHSPRLALALAVVSSPAFAEDPRRFDAPITVITSEGEAVPLPAGIFLTASQFEKLDLEVVRLQNTETRYAAENTSLRESIAETSKTLRITIGAAALAVVTCAIVTWRWGERGRLAAARDTP